MRLDCFESVNKNLLCDHSQESHGLLIGCSLFFSPLMVFSMIILATLGKKRDKTDVSQNKLQFIQVTVNLF